MLVYEEILKFVSNPPYQFRPFELVDELGISRQHVTNLLSRLRGLGLLEKDKSVYRVPQDGLNNFIEFVLNAHKLEENPKARMTVIDGAFNTEDVKYFKGMSNAVLSAQQQKLEGYVVAKQNWMEILEQAQAAIKRELKFVRTHSKTVANVSEEDIETALNLLVK